jgi:hypothetical protein
MHWAADRESYLALIRNLLPERITEFFELSKIVEVLTGLHICLEEKNLPPSEYRDRLATRLVTIFRPCKSTVRAFKKLALYYNAFEDCHQRP